MTPDHIPEHLRYSFASFTWPRYIVHLPRGDLQKRLEKSKKPSFVGKPYHDPQPITKAEPNEGKGFYLNDKRTMPGLRWAWCDELPSDWDMGSEWVWTGHGEPQCVRLNQPRINHKGWFVDDFQDETIRGIVFKLPKQRGYLAGWSMGYQIASALEAELFDNARDAALAADSIARNTAEKEWEYQMEQEQEDLRWERFEQWFHDNVETIASDLLCNPVDSRLNELSEEAMSLLKEEFINEVCRRSDEIDSGYHPSMILWAEYREEKTTLRRGRFFDWLFNQACDLIRRKKEIIYDYTDFV